MHFGRKDKAQKMVHFSRKRPCRYLEAVAVLSSSPQAGGDEWQTGKHLFYETSFATGSAQAHPYPVWAPYLLPLLTVLLHPNTSKGGWFWREKDC